MNCAILAFVLVPELQLQSQSRALLDSLERVGYFQEMTRSQTQACRSQVATQGTPWGLSCRRVLQADAEELAEGAFPTLFKSVVPLLKANRAATHIPRTKNLPNGYLVFLDDGRAVDLYDPTSISDKYDAWERAVYVFEIIVNLRLKKAGSRERLYAVYFANDQLFALLTPEMYRAIMESGLDEEHRPDPLPPQPQ